MYKKIISGLLFGGILLAGLPAAFGQGMGTAEIFGGPSLLGRGQGPNTGQMRELSGLRLGGGIMGIHDSGLLNVQVDSQGDIPQFSSYGVEGFLGASGAKVLRHTVVGLQYRGDYRHYFSNQFFNGSNQSLSLVLQHQFSKRWSVNLRESAGTFNRAFFGGTAAGLLDPGFALAPTNEFFDNRTTFLSSGADLTYLANPRLSYNFGADGFLIRRRSDSLADMSGARARGDVAYRTGRYTTISVGYHYNYWEFRKTFGSTNSHMPYVNISQQIGPQWEVSLLGGILRQESQGLNVVEIDPAVAAIIGRTTGIETFYSVSYLPNLQLRATRQLRRGNITFDVGQTVNAGNGLLLTARFQTAGVTYHHAVSRTVGVDFGLAHSRLSSLAFDAGRLEQTIAHFSVNYALTRQWHVNMQAQYRRSEADLTVFRRNASRLAIGLTYSPGDDPLIYWH